MRSLTSLFVLVLATLGLAASAKTHKDVTALQIGVKFRPAECVQKAQTGDSVEVHYTGMLTNGDVFDSSVTRALPFKFTLGANQVIRGWDAGIAGMCVGEKRKLQIPPNMGYGQQGSGEKIPGGATLIFETELISIGPAPGKVGPGVGTETAGHGRSIMAGGGGFDAAL